MPYEKFDVWEAQNTQDRYDSLDEGIRKPPFATDSTDEDHPGSLNAKPHEAWAGLSNHSSAIDRAMWLDGKQWTAPNKVEAPAKPEPQADKLPDWLISAAAYVAEKRAEGDAEALETALKLATTRYLGKGKDGGPKASLKRLEALPTEARRRAQAISDIDREWRAMLSEEHRREIRAKDNGESLVSRVQAALDKGDEDVWATVQDLRPIDQEVIGLRHREKLPHADVAARLGLKSTQTAITRYRTAIGHLADAVEYRVHTQGYEPFEKYVMTRNLSEGRRISEIETAWDTPDGFGVIETVS